MKGDLGEGEGGPSFERSAIGNVESGAEKL